MLQIDVHIDFVADASLDAKRIPASRTIRPSGPRHETRCSRRRQIRYKAVTRPHGHFLWTLRHPSHNAVYRRFRAELEQESGGSGLRYSFVIRHNSAKHEVGIDAKTGKVLENSIEGEHPD
jgi:hypothetical protein